MFINFSHAKILKIIHNTQFFVKKSANPAKDYSLTAVTAPPKPRSDIEFGFINKTRAEGILHGIMGTVDT
ncbi:MAG: hypothetical protein II055_05910, partial [Prevotella sp.]|nr:hypothetical protein [Prevotella sp.]